MMSTSVATSETLRTIDLKESDVGEGSSARLVSGFNHVPGIIVREDLFKHQPVIPAVYALLANSITELLGTNRLNADQVTDSKSSLKNVEFQSTRNKRMLKLFPKKSLSFCAAFIG